MKASGDKRSSLHQNSRIKAGRALVLHSIRSRCFPQKQRISGCLLVCDWVDVHETLYLFSWVSGAAELTNAAAAAVDCCLRNTLLHKLTRTTAHTDTHTHTRHTHTRHTHTRHTHTRHTHTRHTHTRHTHTRHTHTRHTHTRHTHTRHTHTRHTHTRDTHTRDTHTHETHTHETHTHETHTHETHTHTHPVRTDHETVWQN